ncbi:esterase/lipase family protein [Paractinoplanes brasiliensis]|uniref:Triacylglycerol esterase/lipase EstA (Alpha/beta hydrolase family) n=1 Tax=Paractinoplanes brasiliensis TaxID=52695 RepID=A0A4V3C5X0_9ACTN|nr:alpha/beta fold hydrolase [Actinoplanes brasiliensis]TDO31498.1 triacylglycerol esterase/lipase EstA (alpha/beta hydrolase family) [Actinoplanes brasiliensis]GID30894.1 lipase [Actinoplanes brasiliensis]
MRWWLLGGAGLAAVVLLALICVRVLGDDLDDGPRPDQSRPGPVLLVPGYGGSRTALTQLAGRLTAEGRTAEVLTLPGDGTGSLEEQADLLDAEVTRALAAGAPSVDVIGYSAGGVVTRLWVAEHRGAERARRVVSLGSPLHGTRLAGLGASFARAQCPTACQQLAPGSDLLESIDDRLPAGLPWLSIWTTNDETVQPPDSARLDGAINLPLQTLCPAARTTHGGLPTDPYVVAMVLDALGAHPMTEPTACPA